LRGTPFLTFGQTLLSASRPTRRKQALTINPKSIYYEKHSILTEVGEEWFIIEGDFFSGPVVQSTYSTTCREDPLGLPSAAWAFGRMVLYGKIPIRMGRWIGPIRPTEDPAGLPYNWIGQLD
jgi:hypothetical protein